MASECEGPAKYALKQSTWVRALNPLMRNTHCSCFGDPCASFVLGMPVQRAERYAILLVTRLISEKPNRFREFRYVVIKRLA